MGPTETILVMMSNYFHDFATALLICNLLLFWFLRRRLTGSAALSEEQQRRLLDFSGKISLAALVWIIVGGIIRTVYYERFEWAQAAGRGQVVALGIKHALMGTATLVGVVWQGSLWWRQRRRERGG